MTIKSKYKLIKKFSSLFSIKSGSIFQSNDGKCYRVSKWFSLLYNIYFILLSSEAAIILALLFAYYLDSFIGIWWLDIIASIAAILIVEVAIIALVPLVQVPCWEKSLQKKQKIGMQH